jgi:hypothetical protein
MYYRESTVHGEQEAGYYEAVLDASGLASGLYLDRLTVGSSVQTHKAPLLRRPPPIWEAKERPEEDMWTVRSH